MTLNSWTPDMSSCILVAMFQGDPLLYLGKKVQLVCFCKLQCNILVTEKRCCACRKWYFLHAQSGHEKFCHLYYLPTTTALQQQQTVLILCGRILANLVDLQNTLLRRIHLKLIRITGLQISISLLLLKHFWSYPSIIILQISHI